MEMQNSTWTRALAYDVNESSGIRRDQGCGLFVLSSIFIVVVFDFAQAAEVHRQECTRQDQRRLRQCYFLTDDSASIKFALDLFNRRSRDQSPMGYYVSYDWVSRLRVHVCCSVKSICKH